jgi:tetratricopeptide (TPR) repeat protein
MNAAWIYLLHGQYSAARRLLEKAVAIEESGEPGIVTFIGSLTLMGNLFLMQNRLDSAGEWYRRSLSLLEKTDHVYKHAFLALTYCGLGRIEISRREYDRALDLYKKAKGAVAAGPEGLGLGYMQVKALLGMAVTFHDLGLIRESKNSFLEAEELLRTKQGYDFSWIWDGCDAQAYYDLAAHQALCRNTAKAMELLALARGCGWADLVRLDADTFFSSLRELPQFQSLREELEHRNSLPEHPDF